MTIDLCIHMRIMGDYRKNENPELVRIFSDELGPSNLATQLKDAQSEAVRNMARAVAPPRYSIALARGYFGWHCGIQNVDPNELGGKRPIPSGLKEIEKQAVGSILSPPRRWQSLPRKH